LPVWVTVQAPQIVKLALDVDPGELEAICLAREIHADAILMDDRAGRKSAIECGLAVIGTLGLLEQASTLGLIELPTVLARLAQTNARLDPALIRTVLARHQARQAGH